MTEVPLRELCCLAVTLYQLACCVSRRLLATVPATTGAGRCECLDVRVLPSGYTAFMIACRDGSAQIVHALIEKGCSTDLTNRKGLTGWDIAKLENHSDVCNPTSFERALFVATSARVSAKVMMCCCCFASGLLRLGHVYQARS